MSQAPGADQDADTRDDQHTGAEEIAQRLYAATFGASSAVPETDSHLRESRQLADSDPRRHLLDTEALAAIVEEAKHHGLIDPALATDSMVSFCQALGLGAHALERIGGGGG